MALHSNTVPLANSLALFLTPNCPGETISFTLKKKLAAASESYKLCPIYPGAQIAKLYSIFMLP